MSRPRLLDLFCGAGGASAGYVRAGFDVVGVDIEHHGDYPYEFHQADAMTYPLNGFDAIHASPPCQGYSVTKSLHHSDYPLLIGGVRERLLDAGVPYVIENVVGARAHMVEPIVLCGSMFGLGVWRHRLFESDVFMMPPQCRHDLCPEPIDVTGTGGPSTKPRTGGGRSRKPRSLAHAREVMGINWMSRRDLSESIPPAYTEWIGRQLIEAMVTT